MTKAQLLLIVALLAAAAITAGVAMNWGAAWGLIAGGILTIVGVIFLYDPAEKRAS